MTLLPPASAVAATTRFYARMRALVSPCHKPPHTNCMQVANDAMEEIRSTGSPSPRLEAAQFYDASSAEEARLDISSVVSSPSSQYSYLPPVASFERSPLGTETASERRPRDVAVDLSAYTEQRNSTDSTTRNTTGPQPFLGSQSPPADSPGGSPVARQGGQARECVATVLESLH